MELVLVPLASEYAKQGSVCWFPVFLQGTGTLSCIFESEGKIHPFFILL